MRKDASFAAIAVVVAFPSTRQTLCAVVTHRILFAHFSGIYSKANLRPLLFLPCRGFPLSWFLHRCCYLGLDLVYNIAQGIAHAHLTIGPVPIAAGEMPDHALFCLAARCRFLPNRLFHHAGSLLGHDAESTLVSCPGHN